MIEKQIAIEHEHSSDDSDTQSTALQNVATIIRDIGPRIVNSISPRTWPQDGLYHYTSGEGFMNIINSNSLRFSDCLFLNDGSEVHYANQLLWAAVARFCEGKPTRVKNFAQIALDEIIQTAVKGRPVVFCLSKKPDLLNQWRDYGRDVVPYCFQLEPSELEKKDWSFEVNLIEMICDEELQNRILDDLMLGLHALLRPIARDLADPAIHEAILNHVVSQVWGVLIQFKNPAYSAEQEWRLISYYPLLEGQEVEFRTNSLGIVPFFTRRPQVGTRLPIKHVWVGPSPWGDVSLNALAIFLRMKGYQVGITASAIPSR